MVNGQTGLHGASVAPPVARGDNSDRGHVTTLNPPIRVEDVVGQMQKRDNAQLLLVQVGLCFYSVAIL